MNKTKNNVEERLEVLLYSAITYLHDQTIEYEDDTYQWYLDLKEALGATDEELRKYCGIKGDPDNGLLWDC